MRSLVFVGAHDRDTILRAADAGMDALCFDLEDLTPAVDKPTARSIFRSVAAEVAARGVTVFARTNALDDGAAQADLEAIVGPDLHCVNLPKAEAPDEVAALDELLDSAEASAGLPAGRIWIRPVIETATGVRRAYEIAAASPRVAYMGGVEGSAWGDLGASLGYRQTDDGSETAYLRAKVLVDVRSAGVRFPIGGGSTARRDLDGARRFAEANRDLGYDGVHCTGDPAVVAAVNAVFTPSDADVDEWLAVLPRLEEARDQGTIVVEIDGRSYDVVGLVRARERLDLAARLGMVAT
ncbi:MAG: HpcH/HpaI aldolase/citrate lyase family protein [Acidimicrobiales bacterium]